MIKVSFKEKMVRVMVFNATFNNISVISWDLGFIYVSSEERVGTTDGCPFKPKKLSVPFLYPGVPAGLHFHEIMMMSAL
jgi:hypothetical protein